MYIGKENQELVSVLAQKTYNQKVLNFAEKRLSQITKLAKEYEDDEIANLYLQEHRERQKLIQPIELTREQKLHDWKALEYKGKEFQEG